MKKRKLRVPTRAITIILLILIACAVFIGYLWKSLNTSDFFKIKDIIIKNNDTVDLSYLKGKNIFNLDLEQESENISGAYPDYRRINLVRILPNRLFVDFIKRKALALVKLYRYFALDEDGVLFYGEAEPQELELPIILGLETKIFGPRPGKVYKIPELTLVLNIIKEFKRSQGLKNYKIKRIDVTNPSGTSIFIPCVLDEGDRMQFENLEVKVGQDNIKDKIIILEGLITQERSNLSSIKYIDLRFREPVIKFKDK